MDLTPLFAIILWIFIAGAALSAIGATIFFIIAYGAQKRIRKEINKSLDDNKYSIRRL